MRRRNPSSPRMRPLRRTSHDHDVDFFGRSYSRCSFPGSAPRIVWGTEAMSAPAPGAVGWPRYRAQHMVHLYLDTVSEPASHPGPCGGPLPQRRKNSQNFYKTPPQTPEKQGYPTTLPNQKKKPPLLAAFSFRLFRVRLARRASRRRPPSPEFWGRSGSRAGAG